MNTNVAHTHKKRRQKKESNGHRKAKKKGIAANVNICERGKRARKKSAKETKKSCKWLRNVIMMIRFNRGKTHRKLTQKTQEKYASEYEQCESRS